MAVETGLGNKNANATIHSLVRHWCGDDVLTGGARGWRDVTATDRGHGDAGRNTTPRLTGHSSERPVLRKFQTRGAKRRTSHQGSRKPGRTQGYKASGFDRWKRRCQAPGASTALAYGLVSASPRRASGAG